MKLKNIFFKKIVAISLGLHIFNNSGFAWDTLAQISDNVSFAEEQTMDGTVTHGFVINGQFCQALCNVDQNIITYYFITSDGFSIFVNVSSCNGEIINYNIIPPVQQQSPNVTQQQQLPPQISRSAEARALGSQESSKDILQTESKDSKSIKSPISEEERAKGKPRKPKWSVTSNANQIIFNGRENSIANDYMVIISKNNKAVTINVAKNSNPNTSYFKIIGTVTGFKTIVTDRNKENIPIVSWNLINNNEAISEIKRKIKYIHFDGNKYSTSIDKNDCRFIFCQRCATRCIQKLSDENIRIIYNKSRKIISCPIKFHEDYYEKFIDKDKTRKSYSCIDCDNLNRLNRKLKEAATE